MKNIVIVLIAFSIASCQKSSMKTDTVTVGAYKFELIQNGQGAFLRTTSDKVEEDKKLKLRPPCYFLREDGKLQTYAYEDVGVENVIIIIGDILDDTKKRAYDVNSDQVCGEKIQGLVLKNQEVLISEKTISGALSCKDNGLDEKDFWDFAHE